MQDFPEQATALIRTWFAVTPPNETALAILADLDKTTADFAELRGSLQFEDEPSSFEAALRAAAAVEVVP